MSVSYWLEQFSKEHPVKSLCDEDPIVKSLCEKYPSVKWRYIHLIDHGQYTLDNAISGSKAHAYHIPHMLTRCKNNLEGLKLERAQNHYDEYNNGPVLDSIEEKLETVTKNLEIQSQLLDCNVGRVLEKTMLRRLQLVQTMMKHWPDLKNYMDKSRSD